MLCEHVESRCLLSCYLLLGIILGPKKHKPHSDHFKQEYTEEDLFIEKDEDAVLNNRSFADNNRTMIIAVAVNMHTDDRAVANKGPKHVAESCPHRISHDYVFKKGERLYIELSVTLA